jgi:hypothetical protein
MMSSDECISGRTVALIMLLSRAVRLSLPNDVLLVTGILAEEPMQAITHDASKASMELQS